MARIAGNEIQDNLKLDYALTLIKGVGWPTSLKILSAVDIDSNRRVSSLTSEEILKIVAKLEEFPTEGDLVRKAREDIRRLRLIGSYRGMRHAHSLPARGQRTRSNARTKRGKRRTVGAYRKEMLAKIQTAAKGEK